MKCEGAKMASKFFFSFFFHKRQVNSWLGSGKHNQTKHWSATSECDSQKKKKLWILIPKEQKKTGNTLYSTSPSSSQLFTLHIKPISHVNSLSATKRFVSRKPPIFLSGSVPTVPSKSSKSVPLNFLQHEELITIFNL